MYEGGFSYIVINNNLQTQKNPPEKVKAKTGKIGVRVGMKVLTSIGFEACINAIYLVFNTLTYRKTYFGFITYMYLVKITSFIELIGIFI